jgi:hypothetical protein
VTKAIKVIPVKRVTRVTKESLELRAILESVENVAFKV